MENAEKKNTNKKTTIIIIAIIVLIIALCIGAYSLLNKPKTAISADTFNSSMTDKNYAVVDIINQYNEYDYIKKAYVAKNDNYQIEFYETSNNDYAIQMYDNNKQTFENEKSDSSIETTKSAKNYSVYSLTVNGKYKYISRIDNTIIYINADKEYKDEIKEVIKELGY